MMKHLLLCLLALLPLAGRLSAQDSVYAGEPEQYYSEGIIHFHTDLQVEKDGNLKVVEHIKVFAAGNIIQRGIIRKIPQTRPNKYGRNKRVPIEVTDVQKDGEPVPHVITTEGNYLQIRIGDANIMLNTGVYEYTISYHSRGHVGFFEGFDEIYWNSTGTEWELPIVKASATVRLPEGAKVIQAACYTGPEGSKASDCTITYNDSLQPTFHASHLLKEREGLTVAVGFTPGIIQRPAPAGMWEQLWDWIDAYRAYVLAVLGLGFLLPYYYFTWRKHGKDPEKPVVVARFDPPNGYSPAVLRFLHKKVVDSKSLAAALVNMAVKKVVAVRKDHTGFYLDRKEGAPSKLATEERQLFSKMMQSNLTLELSDINKYKIRAGREAFEDSVKNQYNLKDYFLKNSRQMWIGGLITLGVLLTYLLCVDFGALFVVFIVPFAAAGAAMLFAGIRALKQGCAGVFLIGMGFMFLVVPLGAVYGVLQHLPPVSIAFVFILLAAYILFVRLIQAPTEDGAALQAQIEGFLLYLTVAEEHRLNILTPPEHTPQLFERLLPYAIALGVENEWGQKFKDVLENIQYAPEWYSGGTLSYAHFDDAFTNRFASTVEKAGRAPAASSSGSSSGSSSSGSSSWSSGSSSSSGSSGGGGGGGGGGGW
ncbi:DUF2207 domain-containing protein [Chitinophaga horti]|uniref:DUF2207 domain-containing protein n=1 Tax=Chitinophaga horti TaxID=2920382 RepID=A0ABY6J4G0_9BACT|nr:DUF2207 domain-containing protein [Chitinophaga horti]UYQ94553.1 DUF2207 domain-containing protein [Chitinophaga horti]